MKNNISDLTAITNSSLLIATIFLRSSVDNLVNNFTICCVPRRYSNANNKCLTPFDPKQVSQEIIDLDGKIVHLYGYIIFKL